MRRAGLGPSLLAVVMAVAGLASGCATWLEPTASEEERRVFEQAEAALATEPGAGREAFEGYLARFPEGALVARAHIVLGELAHGEGDLDEAARRYALAIARGGADGDRARVRLGALEVERGDTASARRALDRVRLSRLEADDLRNAYRALAESSPDPVSRLRWLALLRAEVPDDADVSAIDVEIDALLAELDADTLDRVAGQLGDRVPAGRVHIARAERALDAGDLELATRALDDARRVPLSPRYTQRLGAVMARVRMREAGPTDVSQLPTFAEVLAGDLPETSGAQGNLGVVLPLSGDYARFGEEALQGVLLAAGVFPDDAEGPRAQMRVVVRDSAGDPRRAAAMVRELAADPEILAIVGPLVSRACEAAAREAEAAEIPLLTLTAREEIARDRANVFRLRTRPIEEAQLLVDRARALGAQRFAILYRNDPYGRGLRSLFWDAVEARGGRVVGVASYDPRATDFAESIRRIVGYTLLGDEERRLIAKRDKMRRRARRLPPEEALELREKAKELTTREGLPIPPIVDFDALFIPESHQNVVLIAPQLAFHEVTGPRLLGTDGWYDPDLVRLGGEHVEGALFAAHFFPDSEVPYVRTFAERFNAEFGTPPGVFAAQGYDAATLVLIQLSRGSQARSEVRNGVLTTESFPGVSGILTMRSDGNAHKRPYLLGVERGRVVHYVD